MNVLDRILNVFLLQKGLIDKREREMKEIKAQSGGFGNGDFQIFCACAKPMQQLKLVWSKQ